MVKCIKSHKGYYSCERCVLKGKPIGKSVFPILPYRTLIAFVLESKQLYGEKFITYNTHSLLHIVEDVKCFGCSLNELSCFPFENQLAKLKRGVHNAKNPVAQLSKRLKLLENANLDKKRNTKAANRNQKK